MKNQIAKVTANPVGAVVGGIAGFYAAKKFAHLSNKWALGAAALVGVVVGAMAQATIKAKKGAPNANTIKK